MKRVFLGIELNEDLRSKIEDLKQEYGLFNLPLKLIDLENSHIAIKFLDELNNEQIELLNQTINDSINNFKSFEVTIENVLAFPDFSKPRVLALKILSPNLEGLAKKLFTNFKELDFIELEERKYTPHITLGRIKNQLNSKEKEIITNIKFEDQFTVNDIHLFESQLTNEGLVYSVLKTFELR